MIYTTNPIYGKVWKIMRTEQKYMDVRMSTSSKDSDGKWVDSTWFPRLMGHAFNSLKDKLKEGDRIVITKAILENTSYEKDGAKKSSFRFRVLEAEIDESRQAEDENVAVEAEETPESTAKDACPW
jgi:hypothetical protein